MTEALPRVAVVGAGPAGLMAAETLLAQGVVVDVFDAMPSVGRKFLLAGKGGLNLTHSEALPAFVSRYGERADAVGRWLAELGPQALRDWAQGLGIGTFVGSSGRVFPHEMKAAPLLRAWLHRLRGAGLKLHMRHRWLGWREGDAPMTLRFASPAGEVLHEAQTVVLALGGASWARLGSDGAWVPWLAGRGVAVAPLQPSNCGFNTGWSPYFAERHAGTPLKNVRLRFTDTQGRHFDRLGECVLTATGIEGSLVYAASALLRDQIAAHGSATLTLDLVPQHTESILAQRLAKGRAARSLPNHLREQAGLHGATLALLRERWSAEELQAQLLKPADLAHALKAWPLVLHSPRPLDEAISTAGGVALEALDDLLMVKALPGVFCAGEMLDWEAPTGGYLLNASLASGRVAGLGAARWCRAHPGL
jgi:uncharacterized flavoprotein (TIGR03862 family)